MYIKRNFLMGTMASLVITGLVYLDSAQKADLKLVQPTQQQQGVTLSVTTKSPLLADSDIGTVRDFLGLIDANKVTEAVEMFVPDIVNNPDEREAWKRQLATLKSVQPIEIVPDNQENWSRDIHIYMVKVDAQIDPATAGAQVPYYGYDNGLNIRWIVLQKTEEAWKILNIATSP